MTRVREVSRGDLEARRSEILAGLGISYEDLADKAAGHSLVGEEWTAWDEIREIDFLLSDE